MTPATLEVTSALPASSEGRVHLMEENRTDEKGRGRSGPSVLLFIERKPTAAAATSRHILVLRATNHPEHISEFTQTGGSRGASLGAQMRLADLRDGRAPAGDADGRLPVQCRLCAAAISLLLVRIGRWSGRELARSALSLVRLAHVERDNESCFFCACSRRSPIYKTPSRQKNPGKIKQNRYAEHSVPQYNLVENQWETSIIMKVSVGRHSARHGRARAPARDRRTPLADRHVTRRVTGLQNCAYRKLRVY
ncbi:hypothetical protein EVAR_102158_1 [Eumeta japonica]|uniref:Uncharacterized protein n=1 Tax=Eumeta variegata TaxID=151549 RepID=A0A4C1TZY8_EUMVA|nr:hypothetical protein EVAR_102158_1 [Eumeta japonica]